MSLFLTRRNHNGTHLLRTINGVTEQPTPAEIMSQSPQEDKMASDSEAQIYALPASSDEEESPAKTSNDEGTQESTKRKRADEDLSMSKRVKSSTRPTRSSQHKQESVRPKDIVHSPCNTPDGIDWLSGHSQSSQQRKAKAGYGKTNLHRTIAGPIQESTGRLMMPDDLSEAGLATPKKSKSKGFASVQDSPESIQNSPQKALKQPPADVNDIPESTAKFSIPDDPSVEPNSSTNSLDTERLRIFDLNDSPEALPKLRRGSSSSLSSVDSIASALLSQSQKDDLKNGTDTSSSLPPGYVSCPLCSDPVHQPSNKPHPSKLSLRAQQEYCHTHKLKDAHTTYRTRNYPSIHWSYLEKTQIPSHLPFLTKILFHRHPSFYFDTLESKINSAKGNRRKINAYLLDGIIDVARPAYYGARGAKIMSQFIATAFAKQLKIAMTQNKIVGVAGVPGFTSAVLVPELCQRLVMEDLGIRDQVEARRVMDESSEIGLLLFPDDDHVDLGEGD